MSSSAAVFRSLWLLNSLLALAVIAASADADVNVNAASLKDKVKSFWHDLGVYPAMLAVLAGAVFVCCCVLPKAIKLTAFVGILGGAGYLGYKAIAGKFQ